MNTNIRYLCLLYSARIVSIGKLITMLGSAQEQKIMIGTQMISVVEENEKMSEETPSNSEFVKDINVPNKIRHTYADDSCSRGERTE